MKSQHRHANESWDFIPASAPHGRHSRESGIPSSPFALEQMDSGFRAEWQPQGFRAARLAA